MSKNKDDKKSNFTTGVFKITKTFTKLGAEANDGREAVKFESCCDGREHITLIQIDHPHLKVLLKLLGFDSYDDIEFVSSENVFENWRLSPPAIPKFKIGDLIEHRASGERAVVLGYNFTPDSYLDCYYKLNFDSDCHPRVKEGEVSPTGLSMPFVDCVYELIN